MFAEYKHSSLFVRNIDGNEKKSFVKLAASGIDVLIWCRLNTIFINEKVNREACAINIFTVL